MLMIKKNLIEILLAMAVLLNSCFVLAMPKKPLDPYSAEAYSQTLSYYGLNDGLPTYSVKQILDETKGQFLYRNVTLIIESSFLKNQNELHLVLKIPISSTKSILPVIVLFSGFQTGVEAVDLIETQGENILVGFEYPVPIRQNNHQLNWSWDWSAFESIPLLMTLSLHWLQHQNYVDPDRINLMSVSFGSIFTPLALRWIQDFNIKVKTTTLGYGGGNIPAVVGQELKNYFGANEIEILKILLTHQTWIYEPEYHVAKITGPVFIVHGQDDKIFPPESIAVFDKKITSTKKIVILPGSHIQPDRKDLIVNFIKTVRTYLLEQDAINP